MARGYPSGRRAGVHPAEFSHGLPDFHDSDEAPSRPGTFPVAKICRAMAVFHDGFRDTDVAGAPTLGVSPIDTLGRHAFTPPETVVRGRLGLLHTFLIPLRRRPQSV